MIARDPRETWTYVLERDRGLPEGERTVFKLKHLSLLEEHRLFDNMQRLDGGLMVRSDLGTAYLRVLRSGLVGWEGMRDARGAAVEFKAAADGSVSDESVRRLDMGVRAELARAIENEVEVTEAELGKSVPPST